MPRKLNTSSEHFHDPFPSALRRLKDEHDTTQEQLAAVLGLAARQSVTGYTDGSTSPTPEKIVAVAKYYGVTADYLLGLSPVQSADPNIQVACKVTGLSQRAVENISKLQHVCWEAVDAVDYTSAPVLPLREFETMLESKQFLNLCLRLAIVNANCSLLIHCVDSCFDEISTQHCLDRLDFEVYKLAKQAETLADDLYRIAEVRKKAEEALSNGEHS